ncbi:MAG: sodium/solute symporter [Sediminibacterium sp. Gen4]|jgi:solute:Na+ symporter, SSS family|uniref:sodium:solute symporter family transporter n=1 Tax=unclassified Sediminibacterium TaxID=2635961 RepID=UPI0015BCFD15|nr:MULTISPECIES: sodium/solute symporter [unclassified Sediminibacterium]MBW0162159.1 sodium/solute symporter [Sediminibacterium sp.]MBW0163391.1 sodium/solute symporter [Sediminibacterium sp.]NWK66849.1 sodium/solute symporter [Sediminibacterium sp. Gen4]
MNNQLQLTDIIVILAYFIIVVSYGIWVYRRKKSTTASTKDYFLAEGSLTWWAIGASLIASNISAEHFVGMSGEGFFAGIAVAAYEWIAAVALIIVAIWFIPVYLKNKIYTMPQFLKQRYNETVSVIMAVFWLFLYIFVNLTSILYLGSKAISGLIGSEFFHIILIVLALFAFCITIGGMKVIGYTDVIQVAVLLIGGGVAVYLSLVAVDEVVNKGNSAISGLGALMKEAPDHFHMIFDKPTAASSAEYVQKYIALPGITMYFAGQWISNLNYWGCNQYITQRALGADLQTARNGILFAGFIKIFMPVIVMLPGIAAFVLYQNGYFDASVFDGKKDGAYAAVLSLLPVGMKGLSVAALTAAIVASLAGKANSISTIFTLDIYQKYFDTKADEAKLVRIGRISIFVAMLIAVFCTWEDLLGIGGEGGYTFIQKYTGFISPGVFAMFLLGMFWKRTTGAAAVAGVLSGFILSVVFNNYAPSWFGSETILYTAYINAAGQYEIPFMVNMGWTFFFTVLIMVLISLGGPKVNPKAFDIDRSMFKLKPSSIAMITMLLMIVIALYAKFW